MKKHILINLFVPSIIGIGTITTMLSSCEKNDPSNNPDSILTYGTMTDQQGNTYRTIVIGTQTWMAENLKVTKFRNGEDIPKVTDNIAWGNLTSSAYSSYGNTTDVDSINLYGYLYNWYSVSDSRNIAPVGWHVPSDAEWEILIDYLFYDIAGTKLKEIGTEHWNAYPNISATNETGFTALPGGDRVESGTFSHIGNKGYWWSRTEYNNQDSWFRGMYYCFDHVGRDHVYKCLGMSVRCIKDL